MRLTLNFVNDSAYRGLGEAINVTGTAFVASAFTLVVTAVAESILASLSVKTAIVTLGCTVSLLFAAVGGVGLLFILFARACIRADSGHDPMAP